MSPKPREVWSFESPTLPHGDPKFKHHLCIGIGAEFLFVSTYRERQERHRGSIVISNEEVPFLPPTETRRSEISCTTIIRRTFPDSTVPRKNPRGTVDRELMKKVLRFVRTSPTLAEDERDDILDSLYDYYGSDLD